jgi:2-polyprenyl-3-methyl-5-hydroxy-6-metoxy-1,4-benzoquinol methylase
MRSRDRQPELMDQPGLDSALHHGALQGLNVINRISGTVRALWREMAPFSQAHAPLKILDLACGGGDVAIGLAEIAAKAGQAVSVSGIDISPVAIEHSQEAWERAQRAMRASRSAQGPIQVEFKRQDAVRDEIQEEFDVVYCSLFLHHLPEDEAKMLLKTMRRIARKIAIVDDLRRTRLGYMLAWLGGRLLSRSPIVHIDGPLSVRSAFTITEARELARESGWTPIRIRRRWPQRFQMTWIRS